MNRTELKILRDVIYYVSHHDKHLWWQLKYETLDLGYQEFYPSQSLLQVPTKKALSMLPSASLDELRLAHQEYGNSKGLLNDHDLIRKYTAWVINEVGRRARIAAYKTINW